MDGNKPQHSVSVGVFKSDKAIFDIRLIPDCYVLEEEKWNKAAELVVLILKGPLSENQFQTEKKLIIEQFQTEAVARANSDTLRGIYVNGYIRDLTNRKQQPYQDLIDILISPEEPA